MSSERLYHRTSKHVYIPTCLQSSASRYVYTNQLKNFPRLNFNFNLVIIAQDDKALASINAIAMQNNKPSKSRIYLALLSAKSRGQKIDFPFWWWETI